MSFVVRCWYGNTDENALFASGIRRRQDAENLRQRAVNQGFDDASVMTSEEYRALFAASPRSQASARRPYQKSRPVRSLREAAANAGMP